MFNLMNLQKNSKIALKYYKTVNSCDVFTCRTLHEDSVKIKKEFYKILKCHKVDENKSFCFNIGLVFGTHSPALLPAIVG